MGLILAGIITAALTLFGYNSDKVVISKDSKITVDTIYSKESRWYYDNDSLSVVRVEVYNVKYLLPYEVLYLESGDYVDLELDSGNNEVIIRNPHAPINFSEKVYNIYQVHK